VCCGNNQVRHSEAKRYDAHFNLKGGFQSQLLAEQPRCLAYRPCFGWFRPDQEPGAQRNSTDEGKDQAKEPREHAAEVASRTPRALSLHLKRSARHLLDLTIYEGCARCAARFLGSLRT